MFSTLKSRVDTARQWFGLASRTVQQEPLPTAAKLPPQPRVPQQVNAERYFTDHSHDMHAALPPPASTQGGLSPPISKLGRSVSVLSSHRDAAAVAGSCPSAVRPDARCVGHSAAGDWRQVVSAPLGAHRGPTACTSRAPSVMMQSLPASGFIDHALALQAIAPSYPPEVLRTTPLCHSTASEIGPHKQRLLHSTTPEQPAQTRRFYENPAYWQF